MASHNLDWGDDLYEWQGSLTPALDHGGRGSRARSLYATAPPPTGILKDSGPH